MEIPQNNTRRTGIIAAYLRQESRHNAHRGRATALACTLLVCTLSPLTGCDRPKTLDAVQKDLAAKFDAHKSVTADMKVSTDVKLADGTTRTEVTCTLEFLRKDDKRMYRQEGRTTGLEMKTDGRSRKFDSTQLTVADGEKVYNYTDAFRTPSVHMMKQDDAYDTLGGTSFFAKLNRMYDLTLGEDDTVDGVPVFTMVGTNRTQQTALDEKVVYKIGKKDGVVRSCEMLTNDGQSKILMTITNVVINPPVPPEHFVFKAPPDVTIVDVDKLREIEAEYKKLQEKAHDAMHEGETPAAPPAEGTTEPAETPPPQAPSNTNGNQSPAP